MFLRCLVLKSLLLCRHNAALAAVLLKDVFLCECVWMDMCVRVLRFAYASVSPAKPLSASYFLSCVCVCVCVCVSVCVFVYT